MWIKLIFLQVLILQQSVQANDSDPEELKKVLKDFIRVKGMKMDEYTYWWAPPITLAECAAKCNDDDRITCLSFSYCEEGETCSTYEHDRQSAPPEFYNRPGVLATIVGDPFEHLYWDYYERKSENYKQMENQVERLKNLTEINVSEASAVLTNIAGFVKPQSDASEGDNHSNGSALPSELEIAGRSLMLIMNLNPIANASLNVAKEFTDVVVNVSSALTDSSHIAAWKAAQRDPSSPGSSSVVTSAEKLSRRMSEKLLHTNEQNSGIASEAEGVAVWLDIASSAPPSISEDKQFQTIEDQKKPSNNTTVGKNLEEPFLSDKKLYVFPNSKVRPPSQDNLPLNSEDAEDEETVEEDDDYFQDLIVLPRAALGDKSVVTNVRYKNLKEAMPTRFTEDSKYEADSKLTSTNMLNSAVLTTSVFPRPPSEVFENDPVIIMFKHVHQPKQDQVAVRHGSNRTSASTKELKRGENMFCVYWQEGKSADDGGLWSKEGCLLVDFNLTHTVCNCTHLTSFAVLLQIVDYSTDDEYSKLHLQVLGIISKVGCILSLLGVVIMCVAFVKLKMRTDNMKIHFNLGLAVGFADLTFLFEELAENTKSGCITVTILLYYFNMAVLAWMFVEGFHLYSQVVVVFVSIRRRMKYYLLAGWSLPAFFLTISMGILNTRLGMHKTCWLSPADNSIWAFAAPALVVIIINTIILIAVVRVIVRIQPGKSNHLNVSKLRNAVKGSIFLFPLLGTTWLFGLLSLSKETLLFQYLFAITNSLQGFFLFIFHCMCNSEVREDVRRHKWFRSSDSTTSSSPPFLSHAFSLNVASGIRRFRNSITFDFPSYSSGATEDHSEEEEGSPKKTPSLFSKMLALRLPTTIAEKEDKYEIETENSSRRESNDPRPSTPDSDVDNEKMFPLPGIPAGKDVYENIQQISNTLSEETQKQLDQFIVEQIIQNALQEMFKNNQQEAEKIDDLVEKSSLKDPDENEKKMQMSYDSGLNSIENESILDEEEEVWMQRRNSGTKETHANVGENKITAND